MILEPWQWLAASIGASLIGLSKTGIPGLTVFSAALFASIIPARDSVGVVLPVLLVADLVAVTTYRRDANWHYVLRLFPWAALGVFLGYLALGRIDNDQVEKLIGLLLIVLVVLQLWRRRSAAQEGERLPHYPWFAAAVGISAGFTTMVANAAGPIMILYFLAMRLPKIEFIGTAAWYFFILNLFKVPFSYQLGLINTASLPVDLRIAPFAVLGALAGRQVIRRLNQDVFELLALALTLLAALRLLLA